MQPRTTLSSKLPLLCLVPALIPSLLVTPLPATPGLEEDGKTDPGRAPDEAREWFEDAKFGLFIHWGVYSILEDGEWVMNNWQIPKDVLALLSAECKKQGIKLICYNSHLDWHHPDCFPRGGTGRTPTGALRSRTT